MICKSAIRSKIPNGDFGPKGGFTLVELAVVLLIIGLLIALLLPAIRTAGPAARRTQCRNNLKQITLALSNYESNFGCLPPAYTTDSSGNRLHSWRTLILPFLEQTSVYEKIDLSKAWDDPVNAEVFKVSIPTYHCGEFDGPSKHTTYLAFVGDHNYLHPSQSRLLHDITDENSGTLAIMEVEAQNAVHWMSPFDADERMFLDIGSNSKLAHEGGMHGAFVAGNVTLLDPEIPAAQRRAMITIDGGEEPIEE